MHSGRGHLAQSARWKHLAQRLRREFVAPWLFLASATCRGVRRQLAVAGLRGNAEHGTGCQRRPSNGAGRRRCPSQTRTALPDEDSLAKATLERLRINPGADVVVLGSYTSLSGNGDKRIRLDVRVQDTVRGETISSNHSRSEANLFELATQAGQALRQSLGIGAASAQASLQARAALPSNQEAVRFYTEGQERLWAFDYIHARDLLTKAVAADPGYPLSHAALADAWNHLGYATKAALKSSGHALSPSIWGRKIAC